jgi:hypothetical protein
MHGPRVESVLGYLRQRRATLLRLRRVRRTLRQWDEYEAQALLPPGIPRRACAPLLSRDAVESLRDVLLEHLHELEESRERLIWERRN